MPQPLPDDIKAAEAYAASDDSQLIYALSEQNLRLTEDKQHLATQVIALLAENTALQKQLNSLTSEVETLRKDRDRLDWLESHYTALTWDKDDFWCVWTGSTPHIKATAREALDAAIALQHKAGCE